MKLFGNLYDKIYDYDNLKLAHKKARKDTSYYTEVKMIDDDKSKLHNLNKEIHNYLNSKLDLQVKNTWQVILRRK